MPRSLYFRASEILAGAKYPEKYIPREFLAVPKKSPKKFDTPRSHHWTKSRRSVRNFLGENF
jgi:hypothetical protein